MLIIDEIEYFLPKNKVSNEDFLEKNKDWDIDSIKKTTGVSTRYYTDPNETALDISFKACINLFNKKPELKEKVDALIFCTHSSDYIIPSNSLILHGMLNLSEDVFAFDYNLACSGFVYGLGISEGLLKSGIASHILLINADTYSKYVNDKDRSTKVLFGDAAAVSYLRKSDENNGMLDILCSSSGKHSKKIIIPAGGMRLPKSSDTKIEEKDKNGNIRSLEDLHMDGFGVFSFINSKIPQQIKKICKKNQISLEEIDLFIFHQANKMGIDSITRILKINPEKVYSNIHNVGNTVSASIPLALKDAIIQNKIKTGDLVLLSGFGTGLSWASCIFRF
jgi:3-oxoacyl-[acyl-carrier-protein] synthase III